MLTKAEREVFEIAAERIATGGNEFSCTAVSCAQSTVESKTGTEFSRDLSCYWKARLANALVEIAEAQFSEPSLYCLDVIQRSRIPFHYFKGPLKLARIRGLQAIAQKKNLRKALEATGIRIKREDYV